MKKQYKCIWAIVNNGFSETAMETAMDSISILMSTAGTAGSQGPMQLTAT